jgi:hypothetical protein
MEEFMKWIFLLASLLSLTACAMGPTNYADAIEAKKFLKCSPDMQPKKCERAYGN